jgi:Spy/CpxP family protein refolding chaperone
MCFVGLAWGLFFQTSALAGGMPSGKWWHNAKISRNLKLSGEEKAKLDGLYSQSRLRLIELKSMVEKERFKLENLMESKAMDDASVQRQFNKLEKARNKLANERLTFMVGVRRIIGANRFQQLKVSYKRWSN